MSDETQKKIRASADALYEAWTWGSGASVGAGEVLKAIHQCRGNVNVANIVRMDHGLSYNALYLIHMLIMQKIPLKGILTDAQRKKLFPETTN